MKVTTYNLLIPIYLVLFSIGLDAQNRYWLTGYDEFPGVDGTGVVELSFHPDSVVIDSFPATLPFESTVALYREDQEDLLFYSNGCVVYDRDYTLMQNGDELNPGDIHDQVCEEYGYIAPKGMTVIPKPDHPDQYYLIHMGVRYNPALKIEYGPLYYSLIDMELNNGKGAIIEKNQILLDGALEPFVIVKHGNGRDWWIITPGLGSNTYMKQLITPEGIEQMGTQIIGGEFPYPPCKWERSTAISPDGSKYVRYNNYCGAVFLEFDRCSGALANPRESYVSNPQFGGGGVSFSPNGKNLFFAYGKRLAQIAWNAIPDTLPTTYELPREEGTTLHHLVLGPDGNIYGSAVSSESYLHIIENPNDPAAFQFIPKGLQLPVLNARTLPHYPNYELGPLTDSSCDTLSTSISTPNRDGIYLTVYPNPATQFLRIITNATGWIQIMDTNGKTTNRIPLQDKLTNQLNIHLQSPGVYFVQLFSESGQLLQSEKVVVLE